jgi:hypothetical protein
LRAENLHVPIFEIMTKAVLAATSRAIKLSLMRSHLIPSLSRDEAREGGDLKLSFLLHIHGASFDRLRMRGYGIAPAPMPSSGIPWASRAIKLSLLSRLIASLSRDEARERARP